MERPTEIFHGLERSQEGLHGFLTELLKYRMGEPYFGKTIKKSSSEHVEFMIFIRQPSKYKV